MKTTIDDRRILALEIRKSSFGYAIFEGPKRLLDWGGTSSSPLDRATRRMQNRFQVLLKQLPPVVIVVKVWRVETHHPKILRHIEQEASNRLIPVHVISSHELREAFGIFSIRNNDDIADVIARIFPELLFKLPRRRRPWRKEPRAMIVFVAVAVGFAFWQKSRDQDASPDRI